MSSTKQVPSLEDQRHFWNWHWQNREERKVLNEWTERRAEMMVALIRAIPVSRPRILDLGCGFGWFTERLADLGEAHGIDLSSEGIAAAQARRPDIRYTVGNLYVEPLPLDYFDIVVSQEVIAHVEDQIGYISRAAEVLKPGGQFLITTGNKFIMDRLGDVGWNVQPPEHISHQLSRRRIKRLLRPKFQVLKIYTIIPHGTLGILRLVNSYKLSAFLSRLITEEKLNTLKERLGFGWQMVVVARKKT
jgi:2-polyprenyl-3-methyl-5-hydroxy-6-metoxy-1,4-benzoquinol methylase